jgi:hypothetical protein
MGHLAYSEKCLAKLRQLMVFITTTEQAGDKIPVTGSRISIPMEKNGDVLYRTLLEYRSGREGPVE